MNAPANPIRHLVDLFEAKLSQVEFPGVSAKSLRAQYEAHERAQAALEDAREALERAQAQRDQSARELRTSAEQGLAYAQVYAGDNLALRTELDAVALRPEKARKAPLKRRPRRAKSSAAAVPDRASDGQESRLELAQTELKHAELQEVGS